MYLVEVTPWRIFISLKSITLREEKLAVLAISQIAKTEVLADVTLPKSRKW